MPRTRIRAVRPATVSTGGGGVTDGANPLGSSLTTDGYAVDIAAADEPVAAPADAPSFALAAASAETNLTPVEQSLFFAIMQGVGDSAATPAGANSAALQVGATTVTQTVGTGWQNPANAQGTVNGVNATINAPAALGGATVTGTIVGAFANVSDLSASTQTGTVTLTFTGTVTIGALASGNVALSYSKDSGTNWIPVQTLTASGAMTSVAITGVTLANLSTLRFRLVNTHTPSATGASGATLDAVVASFTTTGNNAG